MNYARLLGTTAVALVAVVSSAPVLHAQSVTDVLLERGTSPTEYKFSNGSVLKGYGQLNLAYLYYDDGERNRGFAPVDNDNSSSRFGVTWDGEFGGTNFWEFKTEAEYQPRPSNRVNFEDPYVNDYELNKDNIRWLEVNFGGNWGKVSLGQGSMASDGIAEMDLSGTTVVAYSSISDLAAAFDILTKDGIISDVKNGQAISNLDGARRGRIRYDTPSFSGFTLSGAAGQDVINDEDDNDYYDIAARYVGEVGNFAMLAGLGYNWVSTPKGEDNNNFYSGSASALHKPTGLNATLSGGSRDGMDGSFWYGKLGWRKDFFTVGRTAFGLDYYQGDKFANETSKMNSYAFSAVQQFEDQNLEIYLVTRNYSYDDTADNYQDGLAFMTGFRWKF